MSHLSHPYLSPLSTYNSLTDKHLTGYFNNTRIKRHLQRAGLITRSGRILTEKEYRINAMRRDHQRYIRECLAQAIFHKVLDMERHHQIEIRRKLESFAKKEQVRRNKADHAKRPEEDALPVFPPRPPAGPKSSLNRHAATQAEGSDTSESASSPRPNTAPGNMQRPVRLQPLKGSPPKTSSGSRQKTEDTNFHFSREVDRDIMKLMSTWDHSVGISPYRLPIINNYVVPAPPPPKKRPKQAMSQSLRGRRFRPATAPNGQEESPKDSGKFHKNSLHSNASITMVYLGKKVHLSHEDNDYRDEIKIFQQHCGGENLCVFRGRLLEGESFGLISRRHRGFPFSLTFYINGIQVDRLSSCCEYKHRKGARLGGKNGNFGFINVEGASPCYRCIIAMGLDKKPSPPPKKTEDEEEESETEDKNEEKEDRSVMDCDGIDEKDSEEKRGRASPSSSSSSDSDEPEDKSDMDYEEEREEEKEDEAEVYEADDEAKDEYDEDFEAEEEKTDEKLNDKGQVDDQADRKSKSPSYDEKDDLEHEGNGNEASKQRPETPDSQRDERVGRSDSEHEGNQQRKRSTAEEEMNSAARKIQSLYRKRRIHQENNQNTRADTKDNSESSSSASSVSSSSSEDESGDDGDDEETARSAGVAKKHPDREAERLSPAGAKKQAEDGGQVEEEEKEEEEMEETHEATMQLGDIVQASRPQSAGDNLENDHRPSENNLKEGDDLVDSEKATTEAEGGLDPLENEEEDCKSVQEKIAEAIGQEESSEPESSDSSTDEEENAKRPLIPCKSLDEKGELDASGQRHDLGKENKEIDERYPNETIQREKGSPIATERRPSSQSLLVEDPENVIKEANTLDLEMTETKEMMADNTVMEDEEILNDLKIKPEINEEMDINDDNNNNDIWGSQNTSENIGNGAFNDDLLEEIANMDLEVEQIVRSDLSEDKDMGELTNNEMLDPIEILSKEMEAEEVQSPKEDVLSETMVDAAYSALNAALMNHTEQTLSNVEEENEQNEDVHEELVIESDLAGELREMPLVSSQACMSDIDSAEGAEKNQGRATGDAESLDKEGNSILMKETLEQNENVTGVGTVQERDLDTWMDKITENETNERDSSTNDTKETGQTIPNEEEHGENENGEVITTADVSETVNEVALEVEEQELVNEVVLEVEEPELVNEVVLEVEEQELVNEVVLEVEEQELVNEVEAEVEEQELVNEVEAEVEEPELVNEVEVEEQELANEVVLEVEEQELANEVVLEVEEQELVNEVVLEVEEPTLECDSHLEKKPSDHEEEESHEGDEATENAVSAENKNPVVSMGIKGEQGVDNPIVDGTEAAGDTENEELVPTDFSCEAAVVTNDEGPSADEIKAHEITDDLGNKDESSKKVGELALCEAGETINNTEQFDEVGVGEEKGDTGKESSEIDDRKADNEKTLSTIIQEEGITRSDADIQEKEATDNEEKTKDDDPSNTEIECASQGIRTEKDISNDDVSTSNNVECSNDVKADGKVEIADDGTEKEIKSGGGSLEVDPDTVGYHTEKGLEPSHDVTEKELKSVDDHTEKDLESTGGSTERDPETSGKSAVKEIELTGDRIEMEDISGGEGVSDEVGKEKEEAVCEGDSERDEENRVENETEESNDNSENVAATETSKTDPHVLSGEQELSGHVAAVDLEKDTESGNEKMEQTASSEDAEESKRGDESNLKNDDEACLTCEEDAAEEDPISNFDDQPTTTNKEVEEIDRNKAVEDRSQLLDGVKLSVSMQDSAFQDKKLDTAAEVEDETPRAETAKNVPEEEPEAVLRGAEITDGPVALGEEGHDAVTAEEVTEMKESDTEKTQEIPAGDEMATNDISSMKTKEDISETTKEDNQAEEHSPRSSANDEQ
ncbi:glutamate-rich protein 3 [Spea bombifrons]|uniref:glutamate-rich protein 3 n=1 Tax=Spea bombifrons TaxID=233779 RepID=UPI002349D56E|nr:glutamate-rich protein 3 [Spea bombifrons]